MEVADPGGCHGRTGARRDATAKEAQLQRLPQLLVTRTTSPTTSEV